MSAPQTGQIVWRFSSDVFPVEFDIREDGWPQEGEPGVWHSLDPKALAAVENAIRDACCDDASLILLQRDDTRLPWIVERITTALGLTPPEPKEGGAS